ncbi:hypothetical protein Pint_08364 [Pistacia integerrima]|uniref:Uncharacterized protein n=1 Tax=Pistacia integerrima TaxID=434235 RepID=A0ACC0XZP8_9ROSI|nr:hypothetical protein Pint_08364 [Pistacia integerrima]
MASFHSSHGLLLIVVLISSLQFNLKAEPVKELFPYHGGPLLSGNIPINLIWYGKFSLAQRAIVSDFIASLSKPTAEQPSVASWMNLTAKFYQVTTIPDSLVLSLGKEVLDENYSQGKSLTSAQLYELAKKGGEDNLINVLLTSADVTVEGFCQGRCGTHALVSRSMRMAIPRVNKWTNDCPLKAPNSDIGLDGMVINVASLLAGTVTNPFGNGFFQGPQEAPLEASTACPGVFGKGAYPGFAGTLLVDSKTGASYNANGISGKKYLLPAMIDPETSTCTTLV